MYMFTYGPHSCLPIDIQSRLMVLENEWDHELELLNYNLINEFLLSKNIVKNQVSTLEAINSIKTILKKAATWKIAEGYKSGFIKSIIKPDEKGYGWYQCTDNPTGRAIGAKMSNCLAYGTYEKTEINVFFLLNETQPHLAYSYPSKWGYDVLGRGNQLPAKKYLPYIDELTNLLGLHKKERATRVRIRR